MYGMQFATFSLTLHGDEMSNYTLVATPVWILWWHSRHQLQGLYGSPHDTRSISCKACMDPSHDTRSISCKVCMDPSHGTRTISCKACMDPSHDTRTISCKVCMDPSHGTRTISCKACVDPSHDTRSISCKVCMDPSHGTRTISCKVCMDPSHGTRTISCKACVDPSHDTRSISCKVCMDPSHGTRTISCKVCVDPSHDTRTISCKACVDPSHDTRSISCKAEHLINRQVIVIQYTACSTHYTIRILQLQFFHTKERWNKNAIWVNEPNECQHYRCAWIIGGFISFYSTLAVLPGSSFLRFNFAAVLRCRDVVGLVPSCFSETYILCRGILCPQMSTVLSVVPVICSLHRMHASWALSSPWHPYTLSRRSLLPACRQCPPSRSLRLEGGDCVGIVSISGEMLRDAPDGTIILVDSATGVSYHNAVSRRVQRIKSAPIRNVIVVYCNYVNDVSHTAPITYVLPAFFFSFTTLPLCIVFRLDTRLYKMWQIRRPTAFPARMSARLLCAVLNERRLVQHSPRCFLVVSRL